jgi:hypothetical protein
MSRITFVEKYNKKLSTNLRVNKRKLKKKKSSTTKEKKKMLCLKTDMIKCAKLRTDSAINGSPVMLLKLMVICNQEKMIQRRMLTTRMKTMTRLLNTTMMKKVVTTISEAT